MTEDQGRTREGRGTGRDPADMKEDNCPGVWENELKWTTDSEWQEIRDGHMELISFVIWKILNSPSLRPMMMAGKRTPSE